MNFTTGTIITLVVVLLFYLRLIILQRRKVKVARIQYAAVDKARRKKKNASAEPLDVHWGVLGARVRNWWLMGAGLGLVALGAVIAGAQFLSPSLNAIWWVPLNLGIGLMAVGVK